MTTLEIIAVAVTYLTAASRLVTITRPLWALAPPWVGRYAPSVLLAVTLLGERLAGATTGLGVAEAVLTVVALVLPGALGHGDEAQS